MRIFACNAAVWNSQNGGGAQQQFELCCRISCVASVFVALHQTPTAPVRFPFNFLRDLPISICAVDRERVLRPYLANHLQKFPISIVKCTLAHFRIFAHNLYTTQFFHWFYCYPARWTLFDVHRQSCGLYFFLPLFFSLRCHLIADSNALRYFFFFYFISFSYILSFKFFSS